MGFAERNDVEAAILGAGFIYRSSMNIAVHAVFLHAHPHFCSAEFLPMIQGTATHAALQWVFYAVSYFYHACCYLIFKDSFGVYNGY